ncbi:MAG TPA: CARDB domain-containing protein, partial [Candidatus Methanoperedens sp.]
EVFKIALSFENVGDNGLKWIKVTLDPKDKSLVPLSSDSERVFKDIPAGGMQDSEFWFSLEKDAPVKNYPMDLVLDYMDERGVEYNETKLVGIVAAGRAGLEIAKKTTEPARIKENEPFSLTVKIENTGTGDAKGVTARLNSELEGDTLAYLGEIKKDDYSNAIFTLDAANRGKKSGTLNITYEDDFGRHEVTKELILIVNPADGGNLLPVIVGIIAIAAIIIIWKRRKS